MKALKAIPALGFCVMLVFGLAACGDGGGDGTSSSSSSSSSSGNTSSGTPGGDTITLSSVSALYPTNGANWNQYVAGSISNATDTACNAASDTACIHAGQVRVVEVTDRTSCSGLTASDALGAFDWSCDGSTNPVRMVSTGLKDGKNLSDLIDFDTEAWKQNSVTVSDGSVSATTASTAWWSNPIAADNNGGYLNGAGTIYVVTGTGDLPGGYIINASGAGLVARPGAIINGPGAGITSFVVSADGSVGNAKDFLWVEGAVDALGDDVGVRLRSVRFSALRNLKAENVNANPSTSRSGVHLWSSDNNTLTGVTATNNGTGVNLLSSSNNTLSGVTASNNVSNGVYLTSSSDNTLSGVTASNNDTGVYIKSSSNNTLSGVTASNNAYEGVYLANSSNNTLSGVTATNNGNYGVYLDTSANNTLSGVTATNNGVGVLLGSSTNNTLSGITATNNNFGVYLQSSSNNNTLSGVAATNNSYGAYLQSSSNNTLSGVAAANNGTGVRLSGSSNNYFTGLLKVGANSNNCYISNSAGVPTITNPGLDDDSDPSNVETDTTHSNECVEEGAAYGGLSDFGTATTGITLASSFVGKVTADDAANQSDTIDGGLTYGTNSFASITDWSNFQNPYRGWGIYNANAFPDIGHRGRCTTGTCRIWDWSLKSGDTGDAGSPSILGVLSLPTGDETLTHTWTDASTISFLRNAVEIQGDGAGNENTLCETGETCLYMPNIGSYQGHGSLIDAGAFTGGTITGITLMKYQTNGY